MSTKNLLSNLKNNHRLIIVVILLIILVVLTYRIQRENFQDVNINSLAKAGSTGEPGPPGPSGSPGPPGPPGTGSAGEGSIVTVTGSPGGTGAAGDSALNVLQKLEEPDGDDEKALYDNVFGDDGATENDSAVNILKGLVDHITAKVTSEMPSIDTIKTKVLEEMPSGVPPYTIIPFHINKPDDEMIDAYSTYVNENSGVVVGGVNDSLDILPFGFQVCNGSALQKIVKLADGSVTKTADDSGRNTPDYRGRFIIGGGHCASNKNSGQHQDGNDAAWPNDYLYDQTHKGGTWRHQLSKAEMPKHNHTINLNLIYDWHDGSMQPHLDDSKWLQGPDYQSQLGEGGTEFRTEGHATFGGAPHDGDGGWKRKFLIKNEGNNHAHNNMPPYAVVLYLIKVKDER